MGSSGRSREPAGADIDNIADCCREVAPLDVSAIRLAGSINRFSFISTHMKITMQIGGGQIQLIWPSGTLESASELTGRFDPVPGANSPFPVTPTETKKFYRVKL